MVLLKILIYMKITLLLSIIIGSFISCNNHARKQSVVERDMLGHIVKTYDGFIYRKYDTLGRLIEWYGNYRNSESNSNIHNIVEYSDSLITAKEYVLEDHNQRCDIIDSGNCFISKYYYKSGKLIKREYYSPEKNNGIITGYKLTEAAKNPDINPFVNGLPYYLK